MNKRTSKISRFFLTAMAISLFGFFTACDNENEVTPGTDPTDTTDNNPQPDEDGFSPLDPEENKANLESAGLDLITNMTDLKETEGVKVSAALIYHLSGGDVDIEARKSTKPVMSVLSALARIRNNNASPKDVFNGMRTREEIPTEEEEPISLQEEFDAIAGVYSWNSSKSDFDTTSLGGDRVVLKFPSTENGSTNDAQIAIYGVEFTTINNTEAEYEGEAPVALRADVSVNGTNVITYTWDAEYKANGEPENLETVVTISDFSFSLSMVNTSTDISVDYAMKNGSTTILALGAGATGNFTSEVIGGEEVEAGDVVTDADAYIQLFNIKVSGEVDIESLAPAIDAAEDAENDVALAKAWDDHTSIVVTYADNNHKIAETEFYYYDETEDVSMRLIFADDSKDDIGTYIDNGFEDVEAEFEQLVEDLGFELESEDEVEGGA